MESEVSHPLFLWIAGPVLIIVGLVWRQVSARARQRARKTSGKIRSSGVDHISGAWRPVVSYDYEVDGESRPGTRVFAPPGREGGKHAWAVSIANRFREGQAVTVYYDPAGEGRPFLINKPDRFWMIPVALGALLLGLAAFG